MHPKKWWHKRQMRRLASSNVGAAAGVLLEEYVEKILRSIQMAGQIADFQHHSKYSLADQDGKDFTVRKEIAGILVEKSFSVTVSAGRCQLAKVKHPKITTFWFPRGIETNPKEIKSAIRSIFLDRQV